MIERGQKKSEGMKMRRCDWGKKDTGDSSILDLEKIQYDPEIKKRDVELKQAVGLFCVCVCVWGSGHI